MIGRCTLAVALLSVSATAAAASTGSHVPARCSMTRLRALVGPYVGEATEQHTLVIRLVDRGTTACVLDGFPQLTLLDRSGPLRFRIRHGGDQMVAARPPAPVHVRPGTAAFLVLNENACVTGSGRPATSLQIATPGGGRTSLTFPRKMPFRWRVPDLCRTAADPGRVITVSPFVGAVRAALRG